MFHKENLPDGPEEPLPQEVQASLQGTIHDQRQYDFNGALCVSCFYRLGEPVGLYRFPVAPCDPYPLPQDPHAEGY